MDIQQSFNLKYPLHVFGLASVVTILFVLTTWTYSSNKRNLAHIPTIGPAGILTSYIGAFRFLVGANQMIKEGYLKYKGSAFKVANFDRWLVIVSGQQAIEELRQATEDELSMKMAVEDTLYISYTMGPNIYADRYHVPIIRNQLTKNIGIYFPEVQDEIMQAFDDEIRPTAHWTKVPAVKSLMQVICRATNRIFVGLPLCRDPDWVALNNEFTIDVIKAATIIKLFPTFLRPIVGRLFRSTFVEAKLQRGMRHMLPIIEERKRHIAEYGTAWDGKPNDMLSWLIDEVSEVEGSSRNLTLRIMSINFAAIHTSTMSFTHALYYLAAMPQYLQPLREEVEVVISKEGWTKSAMNKLYKVDSFLKESMRLNHLSAVTLTRKAVKDYTFKDGTFIPKGTIVCTPPVAHFEDDYFANPEAFNGFRFVDEDVPEGENGKHQMVTTHFSHLIFGDGRHRCAGRFFVANEMKAMMAHLVLNYDVKLENEGVRPANMWFAANCVPHQRAEVLFRKRQY